MKDNKTIKVINQGGPAGFACFVAWVGALVYFVQQADGFWGVMYAFLQSIVWPAIALHKVLVLLNV